MLVIDQEELAKNLRLTESELEFTSQCIELIKYIEENDYSVLIGEQGQSEISDLRQTVTSSGESITLDRKSGILHYLVPSISKGKINLLLAHLLN